MPVKIPFPSRRFSASSVTSTSLHAFPASSTTVQSPPPAVDVAVAVFLRLVVLLRRLRMRSADTSGTGLFLPLLPRPPPPPPPAALGGGGGGAASPTTTFHTRTGCRMPIGYMERTPTYCSFPRQAARGLAEEEGGGKAKEEEDEAADEEEEADEGLAIMDVVDGGDENGRAGRGMPPECTWSRFLAAIFRASTYCLSGSGSLAFAPLRLTPGRDGTGG